MSQVERSLLDWQKENVENCFTMIKQAVEDACEAQDIVKQKYCAKFFDISVNTLKDWVIHGCPEIRLESGMVLYSKRAIHEWLLSFQQ